MANGFAIYGFPDECRKFDDRHPLWQEIMQNLERALNIAFTRVQVMDGSADKLVYFFGRVYVEDFMEISFKLITRKGLVSNPTPATLGAERQNLKAPFFR